MASPLPTYLTSKKVNLFSVKTILSYLWKRFNIIFLSLEIIFINVVLIFHCQLMHLFQII